MDPRDPCWFRNITDTSFFLTFPIGGTLTDGAFADELSSSEDTARPSTACLARMVRAGILRHGTALITPAADIRLLRSRHRRFLLVVRFDFAAWTRITARTEASEVVDADADHAAAPLAARMRDARTPRGRTLGAVVLIVVLFDVVVVVVGSPKNNVFRLVGTKTHHVNAI